MNEGGHLNLERFDRYMKELSKVSKCKQYVDAILSKIICIEDLLRKMIIEIFM